MPSQDALAAIGTALAKLVETAKIRILDLVVLVRETDGAVTVLELDSVETLSSVRNLGIKVGGMLSEHDLELASFALKPGMPGVVLVTEDSLGQVPFNGGATFRRTDRGRRTHPGLPRRGGARGPALR